MDKLLISIATLGIIVATFSPAIAFYLDKTSCEQTSKVLGYKCQYSIWTGCIVETKNGNMLLEQIRNVKGEK